MSKNIKWDVNTERMGYDPVSFGTEEDRAKYMIAIDEGEARVTRSISSNINIDRVGKDYNYT